jgi:hypothetical protein
VNTETPKFFGMIQTHKSGDTSGLRNLDLTSNSATLKIEEEKSKNKETKHKTETIGYVALWGNAIMLDEQ